MKKKSDFEIPDTVKCAHCGRKLRYVDYAASPLSDTNPERIHRFHDPSKPSWSAQCTCGHYTVSERHARKENE